MDTPLGRKRDGPLGCGEVVTTIDALQRGIVTRLHAILYGDIFSGSKVGKVIQFMFIYAVGTCADNDARHVGV